MTRRIEASDVGRLRALSARFRQAILECAPEDLPFPLRSFPRGACGDASLLLAEFLNQNGFPYPDYVCGIRGERSHTWLEWDDLIVDITADQFSSSLPGVWVTAEKDWHAQFEEDFRHVADFRIYGDRVANVLLTCYQRIAALASRIV